MQFESFWQIKSTAIPVVRCAQARRKPKIAKGARDFLPDQMAIREQASIVF